MSLADWGAIGNILLGIASVFTAIVTARMLYKQHELQKEQLNAQQLEHQPSFQFTRTDDSLIISNQGGVLSAPIKSTIYSMVIVQTEKMGHTVEHKQCIYCHPVRYYERFGLSTLNLNGELDVYKFKVEDRKQLLDRVQEIYMGILQWKFLTPRDLMVSIQSVTLTDLTKIEYVDMYHKSHVVYYKDSQIITKDRFEQLVEISRRVPFGIYDVANVIPDNIIRQVYATNFELTA